MAYKQSPGRGNNAKTGHGVPSAFMQQRPNYQAANAEESEKGYGASFHATRMLQDYPEQQKHLIQNVEKNPTTGKITSYQGKLDAKKAVEQVQVARDSMNYLGNEKNPEKRLSLGKDFSRFYSPNSKYGKSQIDKYGGGEYQGPDKQSGSQKDKGKILTDLRVGAITGRSVTRQDEAQSVFGIQAPPKASEPAKANPKSGATKKKSPMKQTKSVDKGKGETPKGPKDSKFNRDTAKGPEVKKPVSPMKMSKKTPAKMKKC
jgi:hypothetical protein